MSAGMLLFAGEFSWEDSQARVVEIERERMRTKEATGGETNVSEEAWDRGDDGDLV